MRGYIVSEMHSNALFSVFLLPHLHHSDRHFFSPLWRTLSILSPPAPPPSLGAVTMVVLAVLSAFIVVLAAGDDLICTPSKEQAAPICIERLVLRLRAVNGTVVDLSPAAHRLKTEGKDGAAATSTLQDFSESDGRHHQQPGFLISTTTVRSDYLVVEPANVGTDAVGGGSVAGVFEHATCRGSSAQDEYTYMGNGQCADARGIVPNYAWKNHAFDGGTLQGGCFALCKRLRGCIGFHLIFARNTCGVYSPAFGPGVGANGWPGYSEMSESPSATEIASTYTGQSSEYMCYKLTGPASWSVSTWIKLDKYAWADKAPQVVHDSLVILSDRKTEPRYLSIENGYMGYALGGDNNQHQDKHATTQRIPLKTWTHLEWSVADGTIRTYVNGVQTDLMQGPGVSTHIYECYGLFLLLFSKLSTRLRVEDEEDVLCERHPPSFPLLRKSHRADNCALL